MDDTDRALKFGLFLDSLCAGVSAMPQAARSGGLRPEPISVVSALRAPAAIAKGDECPWCEGNREPGEICACNAPSRGDA